VNPRPRGLWDPARGDQDASGRAALRARAKCVEPIVCTTAQHREMIDQVQELFGLVPDLDLNLMTPDQS